MPKEFWITNSRLKYIGLILLIIFLVLMLLLYLKADEVTKDPCLICAELLGEDVYCSTTGFKPITRTYFSNGSIGWEYGKG